MSVGAPHSSLKLKSPPSLPMPYKFNPFTNALDYFESGGGGGASYIDGEVATYTDLPLDGSAALNTAWLVRQASGTWLIARKPAGIYIRTATAGVSRDADWTYAGILPDVFNDANFLLYDNGDSSKNLAFQLSSITTGTTRTLTVPNANGTIARTEDFAAPPAIGNTTPAAGTFTTLTANTTLNLNTAGSAAAETATTITHGRGSNGDSVRLLFLPRGAAFSTASIELVANGISGPSATMSFRTGSGVNSGTQMQMGGGTSGVFFLNGLGFSASNPAAEDLTLARDAANTLAQRNGTNAQEFRLFSTFTSSTNYQRMTIKSVRQTLSALSGASATTTGTFIPDGAVVVGVTTRVSTLLTGATGYTIGDGTDADRYGDITGTAVGTTSDNRDWTAGTIECFTAGGNITLTAKGSNFTAGAIEISVFYLAGEAD